MTWRTLYGLDADYCMCGQMHVRKAGSPLLPAPDIEIFLTGESNETRTRYNLAAIYLPQTSLKQGNVGTVPAVR
jgi:hypothetical protein